MSTSFRATRSRICFSHKTALQILRAARPGELTVPNGAARLLPDRAPTADELRSALARLESTHPGLVFEKPVHVLTGTAALRCRFSKTCTPHSCGTDLPSASLAQVDDDKTLLSAAELALLQEAARLKSEIALIELAWEACGTYRTRRTGMPSAYKVPPLTSVHTLQDYVTRNPSLNGARKVARILPRLADGSASARETKMALVLGMPLAQGGAGLGIPRMNYEVVANAAARAISGRRSFRCDLCWPEAKLDVEYQSRENHEGELSRIRDSRRANALAAMGWTVIGVTNDELDSLVATDAIAEAIRRRLGRRLQMRVPDYHARKLKLRRQLGLPVGYD